MANGNGNGWTKWLVGTLWTALCAVILFMGNTVKANDVDNHNDHIEIRKEIVVGDRDVTDRVEKKLDRQAEDIKKLLVMVSEIKSNVNR